MTDDFEDFAQWRSGVDDRLGRLETSQEELRTKLDLVRVGVEAIHGKLDTLLERD